MNIKIVHTPTVGDRSGAGAELGASGLVLRQEGSRGKAYFLMTAGHIDGDARRRKLRRGVFEGHGRCAASLLRGFVRVNAK